MDKSNRKILIVEDNKLNMKLFKDILEAEDCIVIECFDPMFAMRIVEEELPNLILMDIQLPRISGYDLIQWIKADANISHIPIIAITAFAMEDDKEKILSLGCEGYMSKPISMDPFIANVNKFLK
ncbi:MAG: response regulator [Alphaproteobacteria bacterium]|jgi:two-component system cell cycle response regulator DivK|uniref:Response regulator n=1 Tax=PS1 clade bacterium TaxID=2175152 RepID=A0A368DPA6_9PROT|nr:two-component system response regulator [Rhodobiaceae bacterium]OUT74322.1 MAG: two-component system response regulator [Rhizobiales bacterium TMED25]RCL73484.1 MAG: response regulator [PS1 clade bacterium]|tara:strand:+ start:467 stop:841 length:375 start_codon:yes stop_codon:yes gene_type:complete